MSHSWFILSTDYAKRRKIRMMTMMVTRRIPRRRARLSYLVELWGRDEANTPQTVANPELNIDSTRQMMAKPLKFNKSALASKEQEAIRKPVS